MKTQVILVVLVWGWTLSWVGPAFAPPINDECVNAIQVDLYQPYFGTTVGATGAGHSGCVANDYYDVWHSFLPTMSGEYRISLCGSSFDTTLAVYDSCGGTELACNDDFCGVNKRQSEVGVNLVGGVHCYIRVSGYGSQTGNYMLTIRPLDDFSYRAPEYGGSVGGTVPVIGTIFSQSCFGYYQVDYRSMGGSWQPVDPDWPMYDQWVINDTLAQWDTRLGIPDGAYQMALRAFQGCSQATEMILDLTVDNTPPVAVITMPGAGVYVDGLVNVIGTANDTHLGQWILQYTGSGGTGWITIAAGTQPVINGLLAKWDTSALPAGPYTLRLVVQDSTIVDGDNQKHHSSEYLLGVTRNFFADLDGDHDVDLHDLALFASQWLWGT